MTQGKINLKDDCQMFHLESLSTPISNFDCSNPDLNDFFINDAIDYVNALMGKSYCFTLKSDLSQVVCAFTISNDSLNLREHSSRKNNVNRNIPNAKRMKTYPAVKIGRLGVSKDFQKMGVGSQLMNFIKAWFIHPENKTGCRFVIVDAYNEEGSLAYYHKNGFKYLYQSEAKEGEQYGLREGDELNTRIMHFDLKPLTESLPKPQQQVVS